VSGFALVDYHYVPGNIDHSADFYDLDDDSADDDHSRHANDYFDDGLTGYPSIAAVNRQPRRGGLPTVIEAIVRLIGG
jgi:hypothetical protein